MQGPLFYLTSLAIILLVGVLCSIISNRLKIPNVLLLVIAGIGLGYIDYQGNPVVGFPPLFLTSIAILALVMIVFDSCSNFKLREFDTFSGSALKLSLAVLILNIIFFTIAVYYIFTLGSWMYAMMFAALMAGTSPDTVFALLGKAKNKVFELLEIEAVLNTPLIVLIPFIILDLIEEVGNHITVSTFISQVGPFILQVVAGIGTGVVIGLILFKIMSKQYSEVLSPIAIITAALLTYIIAENLGGNGVIAVTTLGLIFGNVYLKEKTQLHTFSTLFANSLEILVFVLLGLMVKIPTSSGFIIGSILLFIVLLLVRLIAVMLTVSKEKYTFKERLFITLNAPKGIPVAVIGFSLTTYSLAQIVTQKGVESIVYTPLTQIPAILMILDLIIVLLIYSIILSTIVTAFKHWFMDDVKKKHSAAKA